MEEQQLKKSAGLVQVCEMYLKIVYASKYILRKGFVPKENNFTDITKITRPIYSKLIKNVKRKLLKIIKREINIKSNKIIIIKTEEGHQQTPGTAIGLEKLVENNKKYNSQ